MNKTNKIILNNSIFLLLRTLVLTFVSLLTVRELLIALGASDYGLFNLIYGAVGLFSFINGAMLSSTQRYLSYEIGLNNKIGIVNTFWASVLIHVSLGVAILLILIIVKEFFLKNINLEGSVNKANYLYLFSCLIVFFSFIQSPLIALITSFEKMNFFAYLSLFEGFLKLVGVYALYFFLPRELIMYGFFLLLIAILTFSLYLINSFRILKENNINVFKSEIKLNKKIRKMSKFMSWSLIGNLAWVLKNQGSNVLLNVFFGMVVNAAYAISIGLSGMINNLVSSISNAIKPQIFKSYAAGDLDRFYTLISPGTKYYMYLLIFLFTPVILTIDNILSLWMKDVPKYAADFSALSIILIVIESYSILLIAAVQATEKIALNQVLVGGVLLLNIPISYLMLDKGYFPQIIFLVSILISILALIIKLIIVKHLTKYKIHNFMLTVLFPTIFFAILILGLTFIVKESFGILKGIEIISFYLLSYMANFLVLFFIFFKKADRNKAYNYIFLKLFKRKI